MKCGDRQLAVHGKPQRVAVMDSYERRTHKSRLACSPNHMLQKTNPSAFHFKQATQRDSTNTDAERSAHCLPQRTRVIRPASCSKIVIPDLKVL